MKLKCALFCSAILLTLNAHALEGMKPGLWEHSSAIKSQSGEAEKGMAELKKNMEKMPPEQRKMVEEMMARQSMSMSDKGAIVKVCISKEQAEKLDIPQTQDSDCKQEILKRTPKSIKMKFTCKGGATSNGEGEFTLLSPTSYVGKTVVNTDTKGKKDRLDIDQKGKWLSADCGKIAPVKFQK